MHTSPSGQKQPELFVILCADYMLLTGLQKGKIKNEIKNCSEIWLAQSLDNLDQALKLEVAVLHGAHVVDRADDGNQSIEPFHGPLLAVFLF